MPGLIVFQFEYLLAFASVRRNRSLVEAGK